MRARPGLTLTLWAELVIKISPQQLAFRSFQWHPFSRLRLPPLAGAVRRPLPNNEAASVHAPVPFLLRLVPATALVVIYEHPASPRNRNLLANLKGPIDFKRFSARSISQLARRSRSREFLHIGRIFPRAYCRSSSASISASAASPIRQDRGHRLGAP
jgi:hypothetical protein